MCSMACVCDPAGEEVRVVTTKSACESDVESNVECKVKCDVVGLNVDGVKEVGDV